MGEYTGVRYLGSVKIIKSLIDFHAEQREQIVSKAILKLFHETDLELKPQVNVNLTKEIDRVPHESIDSILGSVLASENPRTPCTISMSPESVSISIPKHNSVADGRMYESCHLVAQHQMSVISFASLDMSVYVSYVAKHHSESNEPLESTRACHVIQCANDMYKAFEMAFNQHSQKPIKPFEVPDHFNAGKSAWDATIQRDATLRPSTSDHTYYNTSGREPPRSGIVNLNADRQKYVNDQFIEQMLKEKEKSKLPSVDSNSNIIQGSTPTYVNDVDPTEKTLRSLVENAKKLPYYHAVDRTRAETSLKKHGDFLIRESSIDLIDKKMKNICLSVRNNNQIIHLVLIDRERSAEDGRIHTRDCNFDSISGLLEHFQQENRTLEMPGDSDQSIEIVRPVLSVQNAYI